MLSDIHATLLGPLNSRACIYFYILAALFLIALILTLFSLIIFLIQKPKEINFKVAMHSLVLLFNIFIAYFINRLLYTMCTKTLG